jgi:DNA mismatch repair protein MutS2
MAEKWGLSHELVQKAQGYLGEGERKVSQLLQNLEQTQHQMETRLKEAEEMKREAEGLRRQTEAFRAQTRKEEERILLQTQEEAGAMVREAREDLRRLINEFKAKGRTDLHRLGEEIQAEEKKLDEWASKKSEEVGEDSPPATLSRLKEVFAQRSGKKAAKGTRRGPIDYHIPSAKREIKVIGLRVEEALPLVDKAIDEAFLGGLKELEVIHGSGTGRLRQAIREHLREHGSVKSFFPGGPGRGGNGVTVVEIGPAPADRPAHRRANKMGAERG